MYNMYVFSSYILIAILKIIIYIRHTKTTI